VPTSVACRPPSPLPAGVPTDGADGVPGVLVLGFALGHGMGVQHCSGKWAIVGVSSEGSDPRSARRVGDRPPSGNTSHVRVAVALSAGNDNLHNTFPKAD
jgi:hypothetical protein